MKRPRILRWLGLVGARRAAAKRTLADVVICEAEARRQALKAQLAAMHKNDSRRGEIERELKRHTFVVLSGGRAA